LVVVGSSASLSALTPDVAALADHVPRPGRVHAIPDRGQPLRDRLLAREHRGAGDPLFVGLVDPGTSSGVFVHIAPATAYRDRDDAHVLDYLASNLYTGHGAHSMFMKTWAAGLAYSNGLHPHLADGSLDYYAERCPLLPQTVRFVIDQLRAATPDPNIARYAIAGAFTSRLANGYESRASEMAADLADGITPELVRAFRARVLELGRHPDLARELFARMQGVYGKVLPGLGTLAPDSVQLVIGPPAQLTAYEQYLAAAVHQPLHRLYPRDFWLPAVP
jgi:hypothetical protein